MPKQKDNFRVGANEHNQKERRLIVYLKITNHFSSISVITNIYRFKLVNFLSIFGQWRFGHVTGRPNTRSALRIHKHSLCVQILALLFKWFLSYT